ncbi:XdhC family protein [Xanthobacter autotrophicus DSM 597]|uniref:XdhC family protein n=1 Tax=Xanthobacter wiegelii TaxID=3119913 RepID=UPI003728EC91
MQMSDGSWDPFDDYVIDFALARLRQGERVALVTLFSIDGTSPRPLGAQMVVTASGESIGYLSGGCLERAVIAEAVDAIALGENRLVRYGKGSPYLDIQLPCGSAIELFFDVTPCPDDLDEVDRARRARRESAVRIGPVDGTGRVLTRHYRPRPRLLVAGTGAAAVQLLRLGRISGFETELLSPDAPTRAACAREGLNARPIFGTGHARDFAADFRTAFVLTFHDHDWEGEFLPAALASEAFYIGAQGSRMVHAKRRQRLREAGFGDDDIARIRGPAGLFHGAKSGGALAVAILAEILEAEQRTFSSLVTPGSAHAGQSYSVARPRGREDWSSRPGNRIE